MANVTLRSAADDRKKQEEEEKKEKDMEAFNDTVASINRNFNEAYNIMQNVSKLISESFLINDVAFDNEKIKNIIRSIK